MFVILIILLTLFLVFVLTLRRQPIRMTDEEIQERLKKYL